MIKSQNIFFIIFIIAVTFLLFECIICKTHSTIENFENKNITIKKVGKATNLNINDNSKETEAPKPSSNKAEDISFLTDVSNENIGINDFYPTQHQSTGREKLLSFVYDTDLFHQIIPKFGGGYLGIIWFDNRINGIYEASSLKNKDWSYIKNSMPENMRRPVFITYDKDKKLLGIFEDKTEDKRRFNLYKKVDIDTNSEWQFIEKDKIVSLIYDKDQVLIGLDSDGHIYKKENHLIESMWQYLDNKNNNLQMRKILYDYRDGYMLGISQDFQIYRKKGLDWLNDNWDTYTLPKSLTGTVRDIWFDFDGYLLGLSRVGLVKKESGNHLSKFIEYEEDVKEKAISIYDVMYSLTGINTFASMNDMGNNSNNVYVDGKKISEYKFKDPKLNKYLKHRMDLKKQCRKMKGLKLRDLENTTDEEVKVRNRRFINILGEQNDVIGDLFDTVKDLKDRHY